LSIRNALRRHEVSVEQIVAVEATEWVSGWGRLVRVHRVRGRRVRVSALGGDDGSVTDALNVLIRDLRRH
jgi:hypothetical protein